MEERAITPWLSFSEPVSSLSHLAGAIVVALLASRLLEKAGTDPRRRRAVWLYLFGVGGMFVASGTYHFLGNENPHRGLLWRLDHAMIWCTIAGTIAQRAKELYGLRVLTPPLELPEPEIVAWWPAQHQRDQARRWFREAILSGAACSPWMRKRMRDRAPPR